MAKTEILVRIDGSMDPSILLLQAAVLTVALVQSATGIGFGLIAGPIMLIVVNAGSAIQVTILLSLLVALILAPQLFKHAPRPILSRLTLGTLVGLPLGIVVFLSVSVNVLKLGAGTCVVFTAVSVLRTLIQNREPTQRPDRHIHDVLIGILSGAMSVSLAMPGPPVAARMATLGLSKTTIRATSLVLFFFSYFAAIGFQWGLAGITHDTLSLALSLTPAALLGLYAGRKAVAWISERTFLWVIAAILTATAVSLLIRSLGGS